MRVFSLIFNLITALAQSLEGHFENMMNVFAQCIERPIQSDEDWAIKVGRFFLEYGLKTAVEISFKIFKVFLNYIDVFVLESSIKIYKKSSNIFSE